MADLSPLPIGPISIPLPYGLCWTDLPDYAAAGRCHVSYQIRGLHRVDDSRICTLSYLTNTGAQRTITVFIKRTTDKEIRNHHFLAERRFPAPATFATSAEVIILEFCPIIGLQPSEADEFLRLIARLNAIEDIVAAPPGLPGGQHGRKVLHALAQVGGSACLETYGAVRREVAGLPQALTHGELAFQQVGWSGDRLVLLDLATLGGRADSSTSPTCCTPWPA